MSPEFRTALKNAQYQLRAAHDALEAVLALDPEPEIAASRNDPNGPPKPTDFYIPLIEDVLRPAGRALHTSVIRPQILARIKHTLTIADQENVSNRPRWWLHTQLAARELEQSGKLERRFKGYWRLADGRA
jgi:hypothetical protein